MPHVLALTTVLAGLALGACAAPDRASDRVGPADGPADAAADSVPFEDAWWRLASLGDAAPSDGARPVLIFTGDPALTPADT